MSLYTDFIEAFSPFPDRSRSVLRPYVEKIVTEEEMRLAVAMKDSKEHPMTLEEIAENMQLNRADAEALLERCESRDFIRRMDQGDKTVYSTTSFAWRLKIFALYEKGWDQFPLYIRKIFSEWWLRGYNYDFMIDMAAGFKKGEPVPGNVVPNIDILLLDEVMAMVDHATDFAVTDCDCRTIAQQCDFPTHTCVRFNEDAAEAVEKGRAERLTRDEMKEFVIELDKKGLIRTANGDWRTTGLDHLCNCCACCCCQFRSSSDHEMKGFFPRSVYVAVYDSEECSLCGACIKRCQFGAFERGSRTVEIKGKTKKEVLFDPDKCWGCGICVSTCPTKSITMQPLEEPYPLR